MNTDVLIVGAGPTGLMMASLLQRSGIKCRIIDQRPEQARESRALGIQARSLELFQNLKLDQEFMKRGQIAKGGKIFLNGKERLDINFADLGRKDTPFPFVFFLSQSETERILIQDLEKRGIFVERAASLISLEQESHIVRANVLKASGIRENIKCNFLVGCDGSHSRVRSELGLTYEGGAYQSDFIMADAKVEWDLPHNKLMVFMDEDNIGIHFPLKDEKLARVLTVRRNKDLKTPETTETTSFPASLEEIQHNFNLASHQNAKLSDPEWVTRFRVHHRCVNKMRVGRIFLAGDAAHIHSPVGAQGMNTGLQDAANLAWKLAYVIRGKAGEDILQTYESERLPIARHLLKFTDRVFSLVTSRSRTLIQMRNMFLPVLTKVLMNSKRGRQYLFGFISQLQIHYHTNAVVTNDGGERMPNEKLSDGTEIFSRLTGYSFHLLVFGAGQFVVDLKGVKIHYLPSSQFKRKGMVLVRPDCYIAAQTDSLSIEALQGMMKDLPSLWFTTSGLIYKQKEITH